MPNELRKAHQDNDWAVMDAYGFAEKVNGKYKAICKTESECVAELMKMYQNIIKSD